MFDICATWLHVEESRMLHLECSVAFLLEAATATAIKGHSNKKVRFLAAD
jgi:hypothetical protein